MSPQRHVILRQTVELTIAAGEDAWPLQQETSRILRKAQPLIERCCDEVSSPDHLYRIERLELDLGTLDRRHLEEELLAKFGEALRRGLAEQVNQQESADLSPITASQLELFSQFIRHGSLPWWADLTQTDQPEKSLDRLLYDAPERLRRLLLELVGDPRALQRLTGYFDDRRLARLVFLTAPALADFPLALFEALRVLSEYRPTLTILPSQFRNHLWQSILETAARSIHSSTDRFTFSRAVVMRLAHRQAIHYRDMIQQFSQIAVMDRFPLMVKEIAIALGEELPFQFAPYPQKLPQEPITTPYQRNLSVQSLQSESGLTMRTELLRWIENGVLDPLPPWLESWPSAFREEFLHESGS
ncbi:hypothetical protein CCP3SC15_2220005 [Gammaproteobacteria bacterium]